MAIRWLDWLKKQGDVATKWHDADRKLGCKEVVSAFFLGAVTKAPDITLVNLPEKLKARSVSVGIGTNAATDGARGVVRRAARS
jgi:hypothetical protein